VVDVTNTRRWLEVVVRPELDGEALGESDDEVELQPLPPELWLEPW
jgi:hypothetical protein